MKSFCYNISTFVSRTSFYISLTWGFYSIYIQLLHYFRVQYKKYYSKPLFIVPSTEMRERVKENADKEWKLEKRQRRRENVIMTCITGKRK